MGAGGGWGEGEGRRGRAGRGRRGANRYLSTQLRHDSQSDGENCSCSPSVSTAQHVVGTQQMLLASCLATERGGAEGRSLKGCPAWGRAADGHWLEKGHRSGRRRQSRLMGTVGSLPEGTTSSCSTTVGSAAWGLRGGVFVQESQERSQLRCGVGACADERRRETRGSPSWERQSREGVLPSPPLP